MITCLVAVLPWLLLIPAAWLFNVAMRVRRWWWRPVFLFGFIAFTFVAAWIWQFSFLIQ